MKRFAILLTISFAFFPLTTCLVESDDDGEPNFTDYCPTDPNKTSPGSCGCNVSEGTCSNTDSDGDGISDQDDTCLYDPNKLEPGICGCGVSEGTCSTADAVITASEENAGGGEGKEMAFDGDVNTKWLAFSDSAWIQYEFGGGTAKIVKAYAITSADDFSDRDPRHWQLQGSNNGMDWTPLDERSNDCFSSRFLRKEYRVDNNNAYTMYRLEITSNKYPATANFTQIAELELLENSNGGIEPGVDGDCDAGNDGTGLRFVAYGDTRSNEGDHEDIIDRITSFDPELVLHSGDLWDGYSSSTWRDIVTKHDNLNGLLQTNLFLVARGNHEDSDEVLDFSPPIVRDNSLRYSLRKGNVFFVSMAMDPDSNKTFLSNALQSEEAQDATWRIVFAHYPVYSAGSHGETGISAVESLFDQYGVDVYFCGHDHHYERSYQIKNESNVNTGSDLVAGEGTVYIVTGGGGAPLYSVNPQNWTYIARSVQHYIEVVASASDMAVTTIDGSGNTIDYFTISK